MSNEGISHPQGLSLAAERAERESLQRLVRSPDWEVLTVVLHRHQRVQEGQRNDLFRPDKEMRDAELVLRQQSYYQGYMDALQFIIRMRVLIDQAIPMKGGPHGESR